MKNKLSFESLVALTHTHTHKSNYPVNGNEITEINIYKNIENKLMDRLFV